MKEHYVKLFHDLLESWLSKFKVTTEYTPIYLAGMIDGMYVLHTALNPDACEVLGEVREEMLQAYCAGLKIDKGGA